MSKNFKFNIIIRILLLSLLIGLFLYFTIVDLRWIRAIYLFIFLVITIVEFIWYVDRTNRDFTTFLLALLQNDFTTKFSESEKGSSFNNLYSAFNQITRRFESLSSAKEVQHLYLEGLVEHVQVGIISFDKNEKIHLMNGALQKILNKPQVPYLKNLETIDEKLSTAFREIKPNENRLVAMKQSQETLKLSLKASEFILDNEYYKLISVQNIKNELDVNELDAWQKLIRVLTHEIMNSVTPITSLSDSMRIIIKEDVNGESKEKIQAGLEAIYSRSSGLQSFTEAYRKLTKIPLPELKVVNVFQQFQELLTLLENDLKNIQVITDIPANLELFIDKHLMNQVFINMIKNAIHALGDQPRPEIKIAVSDEIRPTISISDNGNGIDEDKIDQIFIPFFTTKTDGSGIGLALSRQIIRLHNGTIKVESKKTVGTTFTISI